MIKIKYSIIIPAYNASSHINKCLDSILNQTYENFEVIIVDDGSTDDTLKILNKYAQQYSNVYILSQENAGPGAAREKALKYIKGDYVIFSDADDYWEYNFLTHINDIIEKCKPDILEFGFRKVEPSGEILSNHPMNPIQLKNQDCIKHYVYQKNTTNYLCNKVFSAKLFEGVKFPHLYAGEDAALLLQLFSNAKLYVSIPDIYYNYVMSPASLCRKPFNLSRLDILKSDEFMYNYLSKRYPNLSETFAYAICARSAVLYCELMLSEVEDKNQFKPIIKQQYEKYHLVIKNRKIASKPYSLQRKGIVFLFRISPSLCSLVYKIIKKWFYK